MIKILITSHRDVFSGAEQVLVSFLNEFSSHSTCKFFLFIPTNSKIGKKINNTNVELIQSDRLKPYSDYIGILGFLKYIYESFISCIEINKVVKHHKINIVHHNSYFAACKFLPFFFLNWNVKKIFTLHDIMHGKSKFICLLIIFLYDKVVYVSNATLLHYKKVAPNLFSLMTIGTVIHNGTKGANRNILEVNNNLVFYSVGMLCEWKGQHKIVVFWNFNKIDKVLHIFGEGERSYEEMIKNKSEKNNFIKLLGYKDKPFKSVDYASMNILIHSSIKSDPFPTVVLEAISNNLLPIVSVHGGACEALHPEYRPFLTYDPNSLESIEKCLNFVENIKPNKFKQILFDLNQYVRVNLSHLEKEQKVISMYENLVSHK